MTSSSARTRSRWILVLARLLLQPRRRKRICVLSFFAGALLFAGGSHASADSLVKGEVKTLTDGGFARLLFQFEEAVEVNVRVSGAIIVVNFKKPVDVAVEKLNVTAPDYVSAARRDPDGSAIRIALAHKVKVNTISAAERLYVDLLPENWKGPTPGLPQEVIDELVRRAREAESQLHRQRVAERQKKPPLVRVKVASQPTFVRYIFVLPDTVNVVPERADGRVVLNFDQQVIWDLADAKAALPPSLKSIEAEVDFNSSAVVFALNGTPEVRTFREDRSIILDVGREPAGSRDTRKTSGQADDTKTQAEALMAAKEVMAQKKSSESASAAEQPKSGRLEDGGRRSDSKVHQGAPAQSAPPKAEAAPRKTSETPAAAPRASADAESAAMPARGSSKKQADAEADAAPASRVSARSADASFDSMPAANKERAPPPEPTGTESRPVQNANSALPAVNPNAVVVASLHQSGSSLRIEFPFPVSTPAAVFHRGDQLWLIFDSKAQFDLSAIRADDEIGIRDVSFQRAQDGAAIVRLRLLRPRMTSLEADGPAWIVSIGHTPSTATRPLGVARSIVGKNRASLAIPFDHPSAIHEIDDPAVGDRLMVVTGLGPARGFLKVQEFVELRVLPSTHGVVIQNVADDMTAELSADKIMIGRPGGLSLSATALGQQQVAINFRAYTFDTQLWGFDRDAPFNARQSELVRLAAAAPLARKRQARLNLARFYLAKQMAPEAKAVLDVALSDQHGSDDVTGSVLTAVADVMLDRPEEALKQLSKPQISNQQDAPIWRAIAYAKQGRWSDARNIFKSVSAAIGALPIELQRMVLKEALRSAIEARDFNNATKVASEFETVGIPAEFEPTVNVLIGRLYEGLGRNEDALSSYRAAATSNDRRAAAQGRLRELLLTFATGGMGRKDLTNDLETLTTVWRGDETETEGLKVLAHLYTEDSRYRDAFHVMRTALLAHPNSDMTRKIQDEAAVTFENLFLGGKGEALAPIEALGLFYDFRELTPIGRRGDEMIRRLADRLVSVDLLDQAAELLQHQVDHRLQGAARAQVATRLAIIYLLNRKPDRALATLQATRVTDLSNDLRDQRLLLEARAMSNLGRHDLALELIANITSREATRLRSDVLWAARRWRQAGEQIELLYGERWREFAPLNETERSDILRAAICYALSEEVIGVSRLREKYEAKFADGPDRRAFEIVTAPIGTSAAEFQDVAKKLASIDTLDAFLHDLQSRYPEPPADGRPGSASGEGAFLAPRGEKRSRPSARPVSLSPIGAASRNGPDNAARGPDRQPTGAISLSNPRQRPN
ncbi:MAG TPA: tetratricopeptide repeat protein [Pseudolabrys sp.]|nr:tetratricopeptide repeat protein [Pseudolabrys sp.]